MDEMKVYSSNEINSLVSGLNIPGTMIILNSEPLVAYDLNTIAANEFAHDIFHETVNKDLDLLQAIYPNSYPIDNLKLYQLSESISDYTSFLEDQQKQNYLTLSRLLLHSISKKTEPLYRGSIEIFEKGVENYLEEKNKKQINKSKHISFDQIKNRIAIEIKRKDINAQTTDDNILKILKYEFKVDLSDLQEKIIFSYEKTTEQGFKDIDQLKKDIKEPGE